MIAIALLFVRLLCDCFKSRSRLEAEIVVLRHQLVVFDRARRVDCICVGRIGFCSFGFIAAFLASWTRVVKKFERQKNVPLGECGKLTEARSC
jgi:hypothetical protein